MKILNLVKIVLLCVMTIGLASCGDDNYYTIQNSDEKLCSDSWVEESTTRKKGRAGTSWNSPKGNRAVRKSFPEKRPLS